MKQSIPKSNSGLIGFAYSVRNGANSYVNEIPLAHNTAAQIDADIRAAERVSFNYRQSCSALRKAYALMAEKTEIAKTTATITREILKLKLGNQFSDRWPATGFTHSLAIPRSADELQALVFFLGQYLQSNPGLQVTDLNITIAGLQTVYEELKNARFAVNQLSCENDDSLKFRNEKLAQLRKRISDLVAELKQLISPTDRRWTGFGLNTPGYEETPDAPTDIEATLVQETSAMLQFPVAPRARYYRVYQRIVGVDEEPIAIGRCADPNFTVEDLPRGVTVEFFFSAVNGGGESALSEAVSVNTNAPTLHPALAGD